MKQRTIKFRAWDKRKKKIVFVLSISLESKTIIVTEKYGDKNYYELSYPRQAILLQYTGEKDKNGKEIYEGDIIRILYSGWGSKHLGTKKQQAMSLEKYKKSISDIGFIEFYQDRYVINFGNCKDGYPDKVRCSIFEGDHGEKKVIGNIYENKDLLK